MPRRAYVPSPPVEEEENEEDIADGYEENEEEDDDTVQHHYDDVLLISQMLAEVDSKMDSDEIEGILQEFVGHAEISEWQGIPRCFNALASVTSLVSTYENWPMRFQLANYLIAFGGTIKDAVIEQATAFITARNKGARHARNDELVKALPMYVVLIQRIACQLQIYVSKKRKDTEKKGRRAHADNTNADDDDISAWLSNRRTRMFACLCEILQLEVEVDGQIYKHCVEYVWKPDVMDPDFLKVFADAAFGVLDDWELAKTSSQPWLRKVFNIVKILAIDYNRTDEMAKRFLEKTMSAEFLKDATTTVFPFLTPLVSIGYAEETRLNSKLRPLLEKIAVRACAITKCHFESLRPLSLLIQSLGECIPDILLLNIMHFFQLLHHDAAAMRMAGLTALSEVYKSEYLAKEACDKFVNRKKQKTLIFRRIVSHLRDSNALTRSKTLTLISKLLEGGKHVPREFQCRGLISLISKRLNDKSVMVRRNAVSCLSMFLQYNDFGHDFDRKVCIEKLLELTREKKAMKKPSNQVVEEVEAKFLARDPVLMVHIREQIGLYMDGNEFGDLGIPGMDLDARYGDCVEALLDKPSTTIVILMHYYAKKKILPLIDRSEPEEEVRKELVQWLYNKLNEDYLQNEIRKHNLNDDQQVLQDQREEDYMAKKAEIDAGIEMCKDKLVVEEELTRCVNGALRGVLMGEASEMKESIKFLAKCKLFNVRGAEYAVRTMCGLVWKTSADIRKELMEAAAEMFICNTQGNIKEMVRENTTVANLMNVMDGITEVDRASVEEVIYCLAQKDLFSKGVIAKLWAIASAINRDDKYRIDALRILFAITRSEFGVVESRHRLRTLQRMLSLDTTLAYEALRVVSVLSTEPHTAKSTQADVNDPIFKIPNEDSFFSSLEQLFFHEILSDSDDKNWFGIMQLSIIIIIRLAKDINVLLPQFAAGFLYRSRRAAEFYMYYKKEAEESRDARKLCAEQRRDYWEMAWQRITERLVAFIGEVAVRIHGFIQITLPKIHSKYEAQMKYARTEAAQTLEEPPRFLNELEISVAKRRAIFDYSTDDQQGESENYLSSLAQTFSERRVLKPQRLLGRMLPIVVYAVRAEGMPERIRHQAALAFGKYMTLSTAHSEFAAPMFFTLMSRSPYSLVRCNMLAACSDFALAQPSLFELYAPTLYKMARDADSAVKESTILVLSHLTAMEMVQIRGSLAEPARCLCDDVSSVQTIAASFFADLNRRGNELAELLPEFIYRLACTGERIPFTQYQQIFEYLITMTRDKQKNIVDNMIERVTAKFAALDTNLTEHPDAPKYMAFAMSKFTLTDSGFIKFRDCIRHWSKFLTNSVVFETINDMITVVMKTTKSEEIRYEAEELIERVARIKREGLTAELLTMPITLNRKVAGTPAKGRKAAAPTPLKPATAKKRARKPKFSDSDSD